MVKIFPTCLATLSPFLIFLKGNPYAMIYLLSCINDSVVTGHIIKRLCIITSVITYSLLRGSVYLFSIVFSIHFLRTWQGEFLNRSRASLVDDHSFILVTLMCDLGVICQSVLDKIVHPRVFIVYLPY